MEPTSATLNNANRKAKDMIENATDKAQSTVDKVQDYVPDIKAYYNTAREKTQDAIHASEDFVKRYPLYTVLGAVAVGFLAGYIGSRKRH